MGERESGRKRERESGREIVGVRVSRRERETEWEKGRESGSEIA